ncbi:MAG TPA: Spy/CpxP family protein refolding chaperone [Hydrogenophaga sp.]|nr:Spy/CpxP family protein refolding chaperone [Hydrogenophaga sp.]
MKLFPQRTLVVAAIVTAFVGVSATAIASNPGAVNGDLHVQHLAQRTHLAPEVIQLAQAAQATQNVETAATDSAKPQQEQRAHRMDRSERIERMRARMAERQAKLKAALNLSAEQEPAWHAFVARMQMAKGSHGQRGQRERSNWSELTTPERLDKMQARMAEREAAMNQRFDAIKSFYANLNAEQQKVFDSQRMGSFHRTGMKGGHRKGGHMHRHGGKGHRGMDMQTPVTPQS